MTTAATIYVTKHLASFIGTFYQHDGSEGKAVAEAVNKHGGLYGVREVTEKDVTFVIDDYRLIAGVGLGPALDIHVGRTA